MHNPAFTNHVHKYTKSGMASSLFELSHSSGRPTEIGFETYVPTINTNFSRPVDIHNKWDRCFQKKI